MKIPGVVSFALWIVAGAAGFSQEMSEIRALRDEGTELMKAQQFDRAQAKRDEALQLAKKGLEAREKKFGPESAELIPFLKIVGQLSIAGEIRAAAAKAMNSGGVPGTLETPVANSYYQRALKIAEKVYGADHPETADALDGYAGRLGKTPEARELIERAEDIRRRRFGEESPEFAKSLLSLGGWYLIAGDRVKMTDLTERALALFERTLKASDMERFGEYLDRIPPRYTDPEAMRKVQQRVTVLRTRLGKQGDDDDPKRIALETTGITDHQELIPIHERLLAAEEKKYGPDTIRSFTTLMSLSNEYRRTGDLAKAARTMDRLVALSRAKPGEFDVRSLAIILSSAAEFDEFLGDYEKAQPLRLRFLELAESGETQLGGAHEVALLSAARNSRALGEPAQAAAYFERAIALKWPEPTEPVSVILQLGPLAELLFENDDYEKAGKLYARFVEMYDQVGLGAMKGDCLRHLGLIAQSTGKLDEADKYFRQARAIFAAPPPVIPGFKPEQLANVAELRILAANEALLALERGQYDEALARTAEIEGVRLERMRKLLAFGSERQRLAFQASFDPYAVFAASGRSMELARNVLRYKGLVLDSLLEDRRMAQRSPDSAEGRLYAELQRTRLAFAHAEFSATVAKQGNPAAGDPRDALLAKIENLQNRIATSGSGFGQIRKALDVTVADVQRAIPSDGALVEFIRYQHPVGGRKFEGRYGAVILSSKGDPQWVSLGAAERTEKMVELYQKSVRGQTDTTTFLRVAAQLFDEVWKPLAAALPRNTRTIAISPDGVLNSVSFAALADSAGRFVAQDFSIRYVSSGRDLLQQARVASPSANKIAIFANPSFRNSPSDQKLTASSETLTMRAIDRRELNDLSLSSLPGTARESSRLATLASSHGWVTESHLGGEAREGVLAQSRSPRILHLATHGFVLPEVVADKSDAGRYLLPRNPMLRSGLALVGAQNTIDAWKDGRVPASVDDGILTAEEVGTLQLEGTWLVTLSACDSGGGEARSGEGVLGLRRGFIQAGAQNLLMTLWPIKDEATVDLMLDFYDHALKSGDAPGAWANTQREWLMKLRDEKGLFYAVNCAGAFIMSSQGAIEAATRPAK